MRHVTATPPASPFHILPTSPSPCFPCSAPQASASTTYWLYGVPRTSVVEGGAMKIGSTVRILTATSCLLGVGLFPMPWVGASTDGGTWSESVRVDGAYPTAVSCTSSR